MKLPELIDYVNNDDDANNEASKNTEGADNVTESVKNDEPLTAGVESAAAPSLSYVAVEEEESEDVSDNHVVEKEKHATPVHECHEEDGTVTGGTKIKVITALLIVGFATFIAYWVQQPGEYKAQVLSDTMERVSTSEVVATEKVAANTPAGETQEISMIDFSFSPAYVSVAKGTTVVWTNKDITDHNVTMDALAISTPTLAPGNSFSYKFESDGSFDYMDVLHPDMKGQIIVGTGVSETASFDKEALARMEEIPALEPELTAPVTPEPELLSANVPDATASISAAKDLKNLAAAESETDDLHASATDDEILAKGKLAKSGPEDIFYAFALGIILYLNRRKILYRAN